MNRVLSDSGRALIKSFEGLSLKAYPDAKGYSIGYGHFGAAPGEVITAAQADVLFNRDVQRFEACVNATLLEATQAQFDACVSLAYNIGVHAFESSTLGKIHNTGDYIGAAAQFARWNKSNGVVHAGLVLRRQKERTVYEGFPAGGWQGGSTSGGGYTTIGNKPPPTQRVPKGTAGGALGVLIAVFFCPC